MEHDDVAHARARFYEVITRFAGWPDPAAVHQPGITVTEAADREQRVSIYCLGEHTLVRCGTDGADLFDGARDAEHAADIAVSHGYDRLGRGMEWLLTDRQPASGTCRRLDPVDDRALVARMLDVCPPDDVEAAEFLIDELDPHLAGRVEDGRLIAIAGARDWNDRPGYGDIGVLVHPDARRSGLATDAVTTLVSLLDDTDLIPLYRCHEDNHGSMGTARRAGFDVAVTIDAYRRPLDTVGDHVG